MPPRNGFIIGAAFGADVQATAEDIHGAADGWPAVRPPMGDSAEDVEGAVEDSTEDDEGAVGASTVDAEGAVEASTVDAEGAVEDATVDAEGAVGTSLPPAQQPPQPPQPLAPPALQQQHSPAQPQPTQAPQPTSLTPAQQPPQPPQPLAPPALQQQHSPAQPQPTQAPQPTSLPPAQQPPQLQATPLQPLPEQQTEPTPEVLPGQPGSSAPAEVPTAEPVSAGEPGSSSTAPPKPSQSGVFQKLNLTAAPTIQLEEATPELVGVPVQQAQQLLLKKIREKYPDVLGEAPANTEVRPRPLFRNRIVAVDDWEMTARVLTADGEVSVDLVPGPCGWAVAPMGAQMLQSAVPNAMLTSELRVAFQPPVPQQDDAKEEQQSQSGDAGQLPDANLPAGDDDWEASHAQQAGITYSAMWYIANGKRKKPEIALRRDGVLNFQVGSAQAPGIEKSDALHMAKQVGQWLTDGRYPEVDCPDLLSMGVESLQKKRRVDQH